MNRLMGWDERHLLGSLEWEDIPQSIPNLQIKFLCAQVVTEVLLWDCGNEHNNTEWKLSKRRQVLVALSPLVQNKNAALDSHVDAFFQYYELPGRFAVHSFCINGQVKAGIHNSYSSLWNTTSWHRLISVFHSFPVRNSLYIYVWMPK